MVKMMGQAYSVEKMVAKGLQCEKNSSLEFTVWRRS